MRSSIVQGFSGIADCGTKSRVRPTLLSNIAEGFEQPTDRAFAKYLYTAKASTAEVRKRLLMACHRGYITSEEFASRNELGDEVARMMTGLIKYLVSSDRKDRGLGLDHRRQT
jgi:hypothetical protein